MTQRLTFARWPAPYPEAQNPSWICARCGKDEKRVDRRVVLSLERAAPEEPGRARADFGGYQLCGDCLHVVAHALNKGRLGVPLVLPPVTVQCITSCDVLGCERTTEDAMRGGWARVWQDEDEFDYCPEHAARRGA